MKAKKNSIFLLIAVCLVLLLFCLVFFLKKNLDIDENTATRYEWLEMLGERLGINEYTNESPYFSDVDFDNPYFSYIQSAVEWNVIDAASDFNGDDYASGRFIALTAMKTMGENKFIICFDPKEAITDDAYIRIAIEHGIIDEERLEEGFSKEECLQILENFQNLYYEEFWKDDYSNITYQEGVMQLSSEDVLWSDTDCSKIVVTDNIVDSYETGTIIILEQENTGLKYAREITGKDADGTLLLSPAELDKVVESLTVSDITELTFEDIVSYYGLEQNTGAVSDLSYLQTGESIIGTPVFSSEVNSKGFKISLSTKGEGKERHLEIKITDNGTGVSYAFPISDKVESDSEYSVEIDVDKLCIGGQFSYSFGKGLEYAEVAVDAHATFEGTIKAKEEAKFLLFETPVPLGNGLIGADIQIYIVLTVEGGISFEAELPVVVSVLYEKDRGLRNFKHDISIEEPKIEANCDAGAMLRIEPIVVILGCLDIMDAEADIGMSASAKVQTRSDSQICADVSVSFPVMTLSVCGDDDADTLIGNLGWSAEWKILSSENAPIQLGIHYELLPNGTSQIVEKCTYGQKEASSGNKQQETSSGEGSSEFAKYSTYEPTIGLWVKGPLEDSGDYYTIKGHVATRYGISYEEFDQLSIGDSFWILDKQFTKGEGFQKEGFPEPIYPVYCKDDKKEYYICTTVAKEWGERNNRPYYYLYDFVSDYKDTVRLMNEIQDEWDASELKIAKDALISTTLRNAPVYTAEECYVNNIYLSDTYSIATYTMKDREINDEEIIFFHITFNEKGMVDSMIVYSMGGMPD